MQEIHALKEWQVAVDALEHGEMIVLLRKGGIREPGGGFAVSRDRFLLYPTYEHQKPHLLKQPYASQVEPVVSGWHPDTVKISAWATITQVLDVSAGDRLLALLPFHIWNQDFVTDRLKWKPNQPVSVLCLRVYRLAVPTLLPYHPSYGGCKSWIDLQQTISLENSTAVLDAQDYASRVAEICSIVVCQL